MIIKISIENKRPTVEGTPIIVCGNKDYVIEFSFDDEWTDAAQKVARFVYIQGGKTQALDVDFTGGTVAVPVLSNVREVMVGVYAGDLQTTTAARIPCERSILCGDAENVVPPDRAAELQDQIQKVSDDIAEVADELATIGDCGAAGAVKKYVSSWTSGRMESGTHKDSTGYAYSELIDGVGEPVEYFFDTAIIEKILPIYCSEDGTVLSYTSWKTESPITVTAIRDPKYRLQVLLRDSSKAAELPTAVYRMVEGTMPPIVEKVLDVEARTAAVYVDGAAGADTNDGTKDAPFRTIQKGVDSGAKIVYVATGNYAETVSIYGRDDITIMPTTYSSTYIDGVEETPKIHIDGGESKTVNSFSIVDCGNVTIIGVWIDNSAEHGFYVNRVKNASFVDCIASNCTGETDRCGYKIISSNGVFRGCKAYNINRDGFGISGYGRTDFFDCIAYDCGDDGISHHYGCTGSIVGGEYYNCGKGGVASPTYGAYVDVRGVYSHDNVYGLYSTTDSTHRTSKGFVSNCVFKNNTNKDIYANRSNISALNVVYDTKSITETAVFTEFPAAQ